MLTPRQMQSMDLLQSSLASSSYVNARYATVNNVARDQLNIVNTTINRKFIILLSVLLTSNPSRLLTFDSEDFI
jgi:hypothetical protein